MYAEENTVCTCTSGIVIIYEHQALKNVVSLTPRPIHFCSTGCITITGTWKRECGTTCYKPILWDGCNYALQEQGVNWFSSERRTTKRYGSCNRFNKAQKKRWQTAAKAGRAISALTKSRTREISRLSPLLSMPWRLWTLIANASLGALRAQLLPGGQVCRKCFQDIEKLDKALATVSQLMACFSGALRQRTSIIVCRSIVLPPEVTANRKRSSAHFKPPSLTNTPKGHPLPRKRPLIVQSDARCGRSLVIHHDAQSGHEVQPQVTQAQSQSPAVNVVSEAT